MSPEERLRLISQYGAGFGEVAGAIEGLSEAMLSARPVPGKWSAREIVHHLGDSESISAIRLRRLLVEDFPVIAAYDQDAFAIRLRYNERPIEQALEAFRAARGTSLELLTGLAEPDWAREGWHTTSGRYDVGTWLRIYARHAHDHAAQIRGLRQALGV